MKTGVFRARMSVALSAIMSLLCGCNSVDDSADGFEDPTGTVTGTVRFDTGEPPPAGTVVTFLQLRNGFAASSVTDADGRFALKSANGPEVTVGHYSVSISPPPPPADPESIAKSVLGTRPPLPPSSIPKRYRLSEKSKLSFDVTEGKNDFLIQIRHKRKDRNASLEK